MRARIASVLVVAATVTPAVAAAPPTPIPGGPISLAGPATATAAAVPSTHGARRVRLELSLRTTLQCGRLHSRAIFVTVPAALPLPSSIARDAVRIGGGAPRSIAVSGHTIAIGLVQPAGSICNRSATGTVTVVFTPAAGLGNPTAAGSYGIHIAAGAAVAVAKLPVA